MIMFQKPEITNGELPWPRCQQWRFLTMMAFLALAVVAFPGCSRRDQTQNGKASAEGEQGSLEKCVELWASGKQVEAVQQLTALDWSKTPLFSTGERLGYSDQQIAALSEADRAQFTKRVSNLKALGVHVNKLAQEALAGQDKAKGEAYARSVSQCGEALDQEQHGTMVRRVGLALKKLNKPGGA
jgi:hypothetical protein